MPALTEKDLRFFCFALKFRMERKQEICFRHRELLRMKSWLQIRPESRISSPTYNRAVGRAEAMREAEAHVERNVDIPHERRGTKNLEQGKETR